MQVGVIGASGYSGEALVRLLVGHPDVQLRLVTSRRWVGQSLKAMMPVLHGKLSDLEVQASNPQELVQHDEIDCFFLALPHGVSSTFARLLVKTGKRVIDLSADFRLNAAERYQEYYGSVHPDKELLGKAVYVLPELCPEGWQSAPLIACPGCYPTAILLALIPLLREGLVKPQGIVCNALSGVSGAGKKEEEALLFCERAENATAYGIPKHRHLSEIEERLSQAAGEPVRVQFNPHLVPMRRGILATITVRRHNATLAALYDCWKTYYQKAPFVSLLPSGTFPASASLVGTNFIDLAAVEDNRTDSFVITVALDNLIKGAAGQAIQIMNLWSGFPETTGLC